MHRFLSPGFMILAQWRGKLLCKKNGTCMTQPRSDLGSQRSTMQCRNIHHNPRVQHGCMNPLISFCYQGIDVVSRASVELNNYSMSLSCPIQKARHVIVRSFSRFPELS